MVLEKTAKCHSWHSSWLQYINALSRSFRFVSQQIGQLWHYRGLWCYSLVKMGWIAEQWDFSKSWAYTCKYNTWKIMKIMQFIILLISNCNNILIHYFIHVYSLNCILSCLKDIILSGVWCRLYILLKMRSSSIKMALAFL